MAEFNVLTTNTYAFLDDDAPAPKKESKAKAPAPKKTDTRKGKGGDDRPPRSESRGEGGRGRGRGERGEGGRGRGRGRGGGRQGGGEREPRQKREFDRHVSGTGRDKSAKRDGKGKYNWGEEGEGAANKPNEETEENAGDDAVKTEEAAAAWSSEPAEPAKEPEPEPEVFTLEEYQAKAAAKKVEGDVKTARAVNNDNASFSAVKEVVKSDGLEDFQLQLGGGIKGPKNKGKKKKKAAMDLDAFAAAESSNGRPSSRRGGRGGARGGGRGSRGGFKPPSLSAQHFPELGK